MEEKNSQEQQRQQQEQFQEYQKQQDEEKKKKRKKGWLFGCGGCLVLLILIIIGISACTGAFVNNLDKELNQNTTQNKKKGVKLKKIGESSEVNKVEITLTNSSYTDERNEFADVKAEKVLKIDMKIKNNSDKDIPVGGDVKVFADGKQVKTYPIQNQLLDGLPPNREISGSAGFAINGNPKKIELEFKPLASFSDERVVYDVKPQY